ncbi:MAG: cation:proton antiporter [Spirochaetota bacterium]
MSHSTINEPLIILVLAGVIFVSMFGRGLARRIGLPGMVAFLLIGIAINVGYSFADGPPESLVVVIDILAKLGVVTLLFEAGMHTNVQKLVRQLRRVVATWAGNVVVAGGLGYVAARYLLGLELVPSIVIGVALTATSVGVSVAVWEERRLEDTKSGRLFLGIAGLDDISAVVLMAILFDVAPILRGTEGGPLGEMIATRLLLTLATLAGFGALCVLFSRFVEHRLRTALQRFESPAASLLSVIAVSIIIAACAGLLGFSVAIGAFFAGLAFSGDPEALRERIAFDVIYDLFVPFFFIGIGLSINLSVALEALVPGLVLLAVAIVGKLLANAGGTLAHSGATGATAIGVSMVPRAEITMVVMQKARSLGAWAAPQTAYAAMALVSLVTVVVAPLILRRVLGRLERAHDS